MKSTLLVKQHGSFGSDLKPSFSLHVRIKEVLVLGPASVTGIQNDPS